MMTKYYLDLNIINILDDWTVADAIRELISNAFDESILTSTIEPNITYQEKEKTLIITDMGRGINDNAFIQNENLEKRKSNSTIGKFGVGLKDAISVLFKNNKPMTIETYTKIYIPIFKNKYDNEHIKTIHISCENNQKPNISAGTKITIHDIEFEDFQNARDYFLVFSHNLKLVGSSNKGQIFLKKENEDATIYFNGVKIATDQDLFFSYNILEPNKTFLKNLNRERKSLSRDCYRDLIIEIIKSIYHKSKDNNLLEQLYNLNNGQTKKEWAFIDIKELVLKNINKNIFIATNNDLSLLSSFDLTKYECCIVSLKEYKSLSNKNVMNVENFQKQYLSNFLSNEILVLDEKTENNLKFVLSWIEKNLLNKWKDLQPLWPLIKINVINMPLPYSSGCNIKDSIVFLDHKIMDSKQLIYSNLIKQFINLIFKEEQVNNKVNDYIFKILGLSTFK